MNQRIIWRKKRERESQEDALKTMATWTEREVRAGNCGKRERETERDTDDERVLVRVKESYNCLFNLFTF